MVEMDVRLRPRGLEQRNTVARVCLRWGLMAALVGLTFGLPAGASAFAPDEGGADVEAEPPPSADPPPTSPTGTPTPAPTPAPPPAQPRTTPATSTTPTPATAQTATTGPTESALEDDESTDEGPGRHNRRRFFYLEASAGFSWIKLGLMREDNLIPDIDTLDDSGYALGGGAGFFVSFITLGVQAEVAMHSNFSLGTVLLDLGIRLPTPHLEPYLRFGIGYAWMFNSNLIPGVDVAIRGVAANLGIGFDYMISPLVAIGIGGDATVINVRRSGISGIPSPANIDLSEEGDAIGLQVSAMVQLSLHF